MLCAYIVTVNSLFALAGVSALAQNKSRAVVVGISRYPKYAATKPLLFANNDADTFGQYLKSGKGGKFEAREVALLRDEEAGLDRLNLELRKALLGAQPGDSVYLFISARGIARPDAKDGYLGTSGLVEIKPESTGIAVSDLAEMIRYSKASRVYLFADVCRQPSSLDIDNRINFRMEELGAIPKLSGILASDKQKLSLEDPRLQHGVFSYVLVNGLNGQPGQDGSRLIASPDHRVTAAEVFEYLRKQVALTSGSYRQIPKPFGGNQNLLKAPLWMAVLFPGAFPRFPELLAGLRFLPGLLAMQAAQASPPTPSQRDLMLSRAEDPKGLAEQVISLKTTMSPPDWEEVRDAALTAIAGRAQQVVAEYGVTGLLPEDPRKLGADDFDLAARSFEAAATLVSPDDKVLQGYRTSLEARQRLCFGIAHAYRREAVAARRELGLARRLSGQSLPEIDNATGITYLEEGAAYDTAIRYFQLAKTQSPGWPYPRHNLALAYAERGDVAAAEREYREAIATAPNEPYLDYNLGLLLHRSNRKREARKAYEGALDKLDLAAKVHAQRAGEWEKDLPEEARIARARAAMFAKTQADVHNALGALFESQRAAKRALQEYQAAIDGNGDLCPARYNLAVLLEREFGEDVHTRFEDTVRFCPAFHPARLRLAAFYFEKGKFSEAEAGYMEVLHQVPGNVEAKRGLARVRMAQRRFPEAEALMIDVLRTQPGDPLATEELGDIYAAQSNKRACELYTNATRAVKTALYQGDIKQLRKKMRSACR